MADEKVVKGDAVPLSSIARLTPEQANYIAQVRLLADRNDLNVVIGGPREPQRQS